VRQVTQRTLDSVLSEAAASPSVPPPGGQCAQGAPRAALLKVDTEGHEAAVLRGAARLLQEGRIAAVVFEHASSRGGLDELARLLRGLHPPSPGSGGAAPALRAADSPQGPQAAPRG